MKPRRGERRALPIRCPRCGTLEARAGSTDIGVPILKCPKCGNMDRRLPYERRLEPWETEVSWGPFLALAGLGISLLWFLGWFVLRMFA